VGGLGVAHADAVDEDEDLLEGGAADREVSLCGRPLEQVGAEGPGEGFGQVAGRHGRDLAGGEDLDAADGDGERGRGAGADLDVESVEGEGLLGEGSPRRHDGAEG